MKHRIISGGKNIKISNPVFNSGEKNIKQIKYQWRKYQIIKHRIISGEKNIKISSTVFKSGRENIKYLWREYQNIKHRVIGGGENIKNIKRTIDQWRNITISSIILVTGKISKAICISGRGRWVIFVSFFECKKMPKGQTLCDLEEVATTLHDLRHEGKF